MIFLMRSLGFFQGYICFSYSRHNLYGLVRGGEVTQKYAMWEIFTTYIYTYIFLDQVKKLIYTILKIAFTF